jgi:hypothetical protein
MGNSGGIGAIVKKYYLLISSPPSCPSEAPKERRREKGESLPAGRQVHTVDLEVSAMASTAEAAITVFS